MTDNLVERPFQPHDFALVSAILRVGDDAIVTPALSNNFNVILAALDIAARPATALGAGEPGLIERYEMAIDSNNAAAFAAIEHEMIREARRKMGEGADILDRLDFGHDIRTAARAFASGAGFASPPAPAVTDDYPDPSDLVAVNKALREQVAELAAAITAALSAPPAPPLLTMERATKLWDWLEWYMSEECNLEPDALSKGERANLIGAIAGELTEPVALQYAVREAAAEFLRRADGLTGLAAIKIDGKLRTASEIADMIEVPAAPPAPGVDAGTVEFRIIFKDEGGPMNLRFIEVETVDGKSVNAGLWMKQGEYDALALTVHCSDIRALPNDESK